jgi:predicted ATPase
MKAKLQIRNFGPIKELDIEISKFNILIGPQASGKSTISKILCVVHSYLPKVAGEEYAAKRDRVLSGITGTGGMNDYQFAKLLTDYQIEKFLKKDTYLHFEDAFFSFTYRRGETLSSENKVNLGRSKSYYIPAERIALPMISESFFEISLANEQSTLPRHFLQFGQDFTVARKNQNLLNIPQLNVEFEYKDGENTVTLKDKTSLLLNETSSAIQANLPLLMILQHPARIASLFVIEELELHSFPTLQKELLSYVIERTKQQNLENAYVILPTHSPYILSAANNLIFADTVGKQNDEIGILVDKIVKRESWIDKEDFSAYYIKDGKATSILDSTTGLINENELDGISEDLVGEFDALMDLYKPAIA